MKNKKKILVLAIVGVLVVLGAIAYFILGRTKVSEENGDLKIEKDNIVTETTTFIQDDSSYEITKNRLTKTATIKMVYPIADDVEYSDFFGEQVTMVPFTVNFTCAMLNASFFDPDAYQEIVASFNDENTDSEPITENDEFAEKLEGYKINNFSIEFLDKEDQGNIAKCSSKEKGNENIKFEVFRDYTNIDSLFGSEIGVFEDEKEDAGI